MNNAEHFFFLYILVNHAVCNLKNCYKGKTDVELCLKSQSINHVSSLSAASFVLCVSYQPQLGGTTKSLTLRSRILAITMTCMEGRSSPLWPSWCSTTWSSTTFCVKGTATLSSSNILSTAKTPLLRGRTTAMATHTDTHACARMH